MKTFYIRSIISTHVYTYIKENCKIKKKFKKRKTNIKMLKLVCKLIYMYAPYDSFLNKLNSFTLIEILCIMSIFSLSLLFSC